MVSCCCFVLCFFVSSRRRHTRCALVTGVRTCALPILVYAGSRKGVDELAEALVATGIPAMAYHAGLDPSLRSRRLESFLEGEDKVMVATIAFGMGVDKPDEIGRAHV